jgi:ribose transport system substrate-binding protein
MNLSGAESTQEEERMARSGGSLRWMAACTAAVALAAPGCGSDEDGAGGKASAAPAKVEAPKAVDTVKFEQVEPGSGKGMKLGYVSAGEAVTFNHLVTQSMQKSAKDAGAELVVCDSQGDAAKAVDCAKNLRTKKVQGYLLYQVAADASKRICEAGPDVPVIGISIPQEPCQRSFLAVSDRNVGFAAGEHLGKFFQEKFDCDYDAYVSIEYTAVGQPNTDRMGGYSDGFGSVCGEVKDKRKLDVATTDEARRQFNDVLTTLPGRKKIAVVGIADFVIQGALAAAKTAGREGDVFVSAQGADPSAHCAIKTNPQWVNDAAYLPERWGEIGIPYLIRLVKGEEIPENLNVPFEVVDSSSIGDIYELDKC